MPGRADPPAGLRRRLATLRPRLATLLANVRSSLPRRGRDRAVRRGRRVGAGPALARSVASIRGLLGLSSTRRAVILAAVVCALALSVAVPMRTYLTQRGELAEMQQQREQLRVQVNQLQQRRDELSEPGNVEAEARRRLRYVRPGETPYVVQLPDESAAPKDDQDPPEADDSEDKAEDKAEDHGAAWYGELWRSVNDRDGR